MAVSDHLERCQTIVGCPICIQSSPGPFRREFITPDPDLLMAIVTVCLTPAVHPTTADIILTVLAVWVMRNSH